LECRALARLSGDPLTYLPAGARHFRFRQSDDLAYETEHLDNRERAWRRVRKCRRQLGSNPDGIDKPYPERPAGMSPSRYVRLVDRLDAAEDDLGLPLTLGGPRFAYRPDRPGERSQCRHCPILPTPSSRS
jgi:hypothetical protein